MSATHTPGPWQLEISTREIRLTPQDFGISFVMRPHRHGARRGEVARWNTFTEQEIANAHLVAAAPELLHFVRAFAEVPTESETPGQWSDKAAMDRMIHIARDLVAKAEGAR